jgi:hypothetical protein
MNLKLKVGAHEVSVEVTQLAHDLLSYTATCGSTTRFARHTIAPKHDHTTELLQHDIDERAQLLAEEAAGHEQSRLLTAQFFSEK